MVDLLDFVLTGSSSLLVIILFLVSSYWERRRGRNARGNSSFPSSSPSIAAAKSPKKRLKAKNRAKNNYAGLDFSSDSSSTTQTIHKHHRSNKKKTRKNRVPLSLNSQTEFSVAGPTITSPAAAAALKKSGGCSRSEEKDPSSSAPIRYKSNNPEQNLIFIVSFCNFSYSLRSLWAATLDNIVWPNSIAPSPENAAHALQSQKPHIICVIEALWGQFFSLAIITWVSVPFFSPPLLIFFLIPI